VVTGERGGPSSGGAKGFQNGLANVKKGGDQAPGGEPNRAEDRSESHTHPLPGDLRGSIGAALKACSKGLRQRVPRETTGCFGEKTANHTIVGVEKRRADAGTIQERTLLFRNPSSNWRLGGLNFVRGDQKVGTETRHNGGGIRPSNGKRKMSDSDLPLRGRLGGPGGTGAKGL